MALTQIDDRGLKTPIDLQDNEKIRLGTGNDLEIYHDGTHSQIKDASAGELLLSGSTISLNSANSAEYMLKGVENGAVELYHNNFKCVETDTNGLIVRGPEGDYGGLFIKADEGDDDADNWFVKALNSSSTLQILNKASGSWETSIECNGDGNVELYHNNAKKLETISTGAKISSSAHAYLEIQSATNSSAVIHLGDTDNSDEAQIWYDNYTAGLYLRTSTNSPMVFYTNGTERLRISNDGKVSVGASPIYNFNVRGSGQQTLLVGSTDAGGAYLTLDGDSNGDGQSGDYCSIGHTTAGNLEIIADNPNGDANMIFKAGNAAEALRINGTGHMGLGVTPNANWPSDGDTRAFQIGSGAAVFGRGSGDEDRGGIAVNIYADNAGNKYLANGLASRIYLNDGNIDLDNTEVANTSGAGAGLTLKTRMRIDKDGVISTKSRGANTPVTYEFNYNDGAGGAAQTVNLATIANYNDVTSAVAEVTWVGVYATAQNLIATGKWICGVRRANNNAAWAQTAEEVALSGNGSSASIDVSWDSGVLKAVTVGAWVGWTVNVRITVLNAGLTVNV